MENKIGMRLMVQEVLENILSHLSTAQLLQVRLTSQLFRSVASQLCRKRHVLLNRGENATGTLHQTFSSVCNLPWSLCKIVLPSEGFFGVIGNLPEFLQKFGQHIRSIYVDLYDPYPCYTELTQIIISLPILESVRIFDNTSSNNANLAFTGSPDLELLRTEFLSKCSPGLPKLTKFACQIYSEESFKFFEWLFLASKLNTVGVFVEANYAESVMQVLRTVGTVYLSLCVDGEGLKKISAIPQQLLQNVKQLSLQLIVDGCEDLKKVELFLNTVAPNLQRLSFGFRGFALGPKQIELKQMPRLKLLYFRPCIHQDELRPPLYILKPFCSDQFPSLHRVVISAYYKNSTNINLFRSCTFHTVRELLVFKHDSNPMEDDWATVFPNLESLFSEVRLGCLEYVLKRMQGLVSLRLKIEDDEPTMIESDKDVNIILSGVSNVDDIYKMPKSSHASAERRPYSLHSLTNLKRLELSFPPHQLCRRPQPSDDTPDDSMYKFRLRDSGAYFSILELKPLDYLCLCNVKISEALKNDLVVRHKLYEQLNDDINRRFHWRDDVIGESNFEIR